MTTLVSLAQQDPTSTIINRWGDTVTEARARLTAFETSLRELDKLHQQLAERNLTVAVDLGPIGNAAASVRRDLERETGRTFEMPKGA